MEDLLKELLQQIAKEQPGIVAAASVPELATRLLAEGVVIVPEAKKPTKRDINNCIEAIELWDYDTKTVKLLKCIKRQIYPNS